MVKSLTITELAKAIVAVMKEVKGVEKSMTVGTGNNSYKGVSDKDVKNVIGKSMEKNGLCLLPIEVEPKLQIDRWEQEEFYNGKSNGMKQKQSVFTSVKTKYLLLHESGEYIEVSGYGHGTDTQDKAAGKATTYALKYAMLYAFMVPTGKIDDADAVHSDEIETPKKLTTSYNHTTLGTAQKPLISNLQFKNLCDRVGKGDIKAYYAGIETFTFEATQKRVLEEIFAGLIDKEPTLKTAS